MFNVESHTHTYEKKMLQASGNTPDPTELIQVEGAVWLKRYPGSSHSSLVLGLSQEEIYLRFRNYTIFVILHISGVQRTDVNYSLLLQTR